MKNLLEKRKFKIDWRIKLSIIVILLGILSYSGTETLKTINNFFGEYYLQFNQVIQVILKKPIEIKKREMLSPIVEYIELLDYPDEINTDIEKYICEKFGQFECKTALAIAKAESNMKEDAIHVEKDGTISVGIAQINQTNWKIERCSLKEIVDPYKNIDCAYIIWDRADGKEGNGKGKWTPWGTFNNGNFRQSL